MDEDKVFRAYGPLISLLFGKTRWRIRLDEVVRPTYDGETLLLPRDFSRDEELFPWKVLEQVVLLGILHRETRALSLRRDWLEKEEGKWRAGLGRQGGGREDFLLIANRIFYTFDRIWAWEEMRRRIPRLEKEKILNLFLERRGAFREDLAFSRRWCDGILVASSLPERIGDLGDDVQERLKRRLIGRTTGEFLKEEFLRCGSLFERDRIVKGLFFSPLMKAMIEDEEIRQNMGSHESLPDEIHLAEHEIERKSEVGNEDSSLFDATALEDLLNVMEGHPDAVEKSQEDRRKVLQQMELSKKDALENISSGQRRDYQELVKDVEPLRKSMGLAWRKMLRESVEEETKFVSEERRGRLDMGAMTREWPRISTMEDVSQLPIYERGRRMMISRIRARRILVSLLLDVSGSMSPEKIAVQQRAALLFLMSLQDFSKDLRSLRKIMGHHLQLFVEVYGFSNDLRRLLPREELTGRRRDAQWMAMLSEVEDTGGYTYEHRGLEEIDRAMTPRQCQDLKNGRMEQFVFLVTDGASTDEEESKRVIDRLRLCGVQIIACQVGKTSPLEEEIFTRLYGDTEGVQGISLGEQIDELPERLLESFLVSFKNSQR